MPSGKKVRLAFKGDKVVEATGMGGGNPIVDKIKLFAQQIPPISLMNKVVSSIPGEAYTAMSPLESLADLAIRKETEPKPMKVRLMEAIHRGGDIPGALESRGIPKFAAFPMGMAMAAAIPGPGEIGQAKKIKEVEKGASGLSNLYGKIKNIVIQKGKNLNKFEQEIEQRAAKMVIDNPDKLLADYDAIYGNVINTDNFREMFPDYNNSKEARSFYSKAVHEPASAMAKYKYEKDLANPNKKKVFFTAGGTGAGKSTGELNVNDPSIILYDTNLAKTDSAISKIDQALKTNRPVEINYVLADPVLALDRASGRAGRMGRTVPITEHLDTHVGSLETIKELTEHYKNNPNVKIRYWNNTGAKGMMHETSFDTVLKLSYNKPKLEKALADRLEMLYETGKISQPVYLGTKAQNAGL